MINMSNKTTYLISEVCARIKLHLNFGNPNFEHDWH